jgi:hypothetical protein
MRSMPFAEYQQIQAVNWSSLKHMERSPKHYQFERVPPPSETRAMVKGRAGHTAVLEPELFPSEYVVFPGARRAGKEWDAFEAANWDRTILSAKEHGAALALAESVRNHPVAGPLLTGGVSEQVIEWVDEETSLPCKARIDHLKAMVLTDLKTTATIERRRFQTTAYNLRYHGQTAFYRRGLRAHGIDPEIWLVAVESAPPFDVAALFVTEDELAVGDELVSRLMLRLVECEATQEWPGSCPNGDRFTLPGWAYEDNESGDMGLTINAVEEAA